MTNWFRNRQKDWFNWGIVLPSETTPPKATVTPPAATAGSSKRRAPKINPLFKKLQTRAPAASVLWAKQNKDLIDEALAKTRDVGDRQHVTATMYAALSDTEHAFWEHKVAKQVSNLKDNPDAPYAYVSVDLTVCSTILTDP